MKSAGCVQASRRLRLGPTISTDAETSIETLVAWRLIRRSRRFELLLSFDQRGTGLGRRAAKPTTMNFCSQASSSVEALVLHAIGPATPISFIP